MYKSEILDYKTEKKGGVSPKDGCILNIEPKLRYVIFINISMLADSFWGRKWIFQISLLCKFFFSTQFLYLPEGLKLGLHYEVIFAKLAAACVWALDPLVEAGLVDKAQGPCAAAGGDEGALFIALTMTDPAEEHSRQYEISQTTSSFLPLPAYTRLH
jgi:hypothetical protein